MGQYGRRWRRIETAIAIPERTYGVTGQSLWPGGPQVSSAK